MSHELGETKDTPACMICSRPMKLMDEKAQRWYCYKDDQTFLAKEDSWRPEITTQRVAIAARQARFDRMSRAAPKTARYAILFLSTLLLIGGSVLAEDLPLKTGLISFPTYDLGYLVLSLGADVGLVYLVIDVLLLRDERQRWKDVQFKVMDLLDEQLQGILIEVMNFSGAMNVGVTIPFGANQQEETDIYRRAWLARMRILSEDLNALKYEIGAIQAGALAAYGTAFSRRARTLGDLQLRYSWKFFEPGLVTKMLDIERLLNKLNTALFVSGKASVFTGLAVRDAQSLLRILINAIDDGIVSMPM